MPKIWSKLLTAWPWLLLFLTIAIVLSWPLIIDQHYVTQTSSPPNLVVSENKLSRPQKSDDTDLAAKNILIFGGDVMLSRTVNTKMEKYHNYNWPLEAIAPLTSSADIAIANLESPFLFTDNYQVLTGSFSFKANPKSVSALSLAGFDILSLANNHILNQGAKGLSDTRQVLDGANISYVGLRADNLVIKESKGVKFAFLAYTYNQDSEKIANIFNITEIENNISEAKKQADVVIVMMHAGTEYQKKPNNDQVKFAHLAIDAGADLVIGGHPHWIQTTEVYKDKTIIYSLGNLIFDQMWSQNTQIGLLARVYFNGKEQINIEYIPINIKDYGRAELMPDGAMKEDLISSLVLK